MSDVSKTLEERGGRYGAFINHATIAQGLQQVLHAAPNWSKLDHDMRQAMCVICDKMARILNGDPYYEDNWHDIQGYARLVEQRILDLKAPTQVVNSAGESWEADNKAAPILSPIPGREGYFSDQYGKTWGPREDDNLGVGDYRG